MQLPPNTRLTLVVNQDGRITEYFSMVLGHFEYGVCSTIPQILQQQFSLLAGTTFTAYFVSGDMLVEFESHVLGYLAQPQCMVMAEPRQLQRKDRRQTNRLRLALEVSYVLQGPQPIGEKTVTIDLSSGGLSLVTSTLLPRGAVMAIFLQMGDERMTLTGRVVWSDWKGRNKMAGVEFIDLSEKQQTALTYYLFSLERTVAGGKAPAPPPE